MEYLSVKDVAELKGCGERYIQRIIKEGKLQAVQNENPANHFKEYLIPFSGLPEDLQSKYYSLRKTKAGIAPALKPVKTSKKQRLNAVKKEFGEYSAEEREEITFWKNVLEDWLNTRSQFEKVTEVDPKFVAKCELDYRDRKCKFSVDILYRKLAAYRANDFDGMLDKRGGWNKGQTGIRPEVLQCFNDLYLQECQLPVRECYKLTVEWVMQNYPEEAVTLPSERTFRRQTENIPKAVMKLFREGDKAYTDECGSYIERLYDGLEANDVWIADNHTFDIITQTDDGEKLHRMYITGFLDAKSGVLVGWNITESPSSQSTILALRHGIQRHGAPRIIYVDNGREFLTLDIGGKGHRGRRTQKDAARPPTILERLGIEMRNAIPENARAKPIERMFLTLKNSMSRMFPTFTGGNIIERPESLPYMLKHGIVPFDWELREKIETMIVGTYNTDLYGGSERKFKGMRRIDVWNKSIKTHGIRQVSERDLDLLLLRNTGYQKVKRNGVFITIAGEKLWYNCDENWKYLDQNVYVRFDPAEIENVRIYDENDKYIATWALDRSLYVDFITANKEDIGNREQKRRRAYKAVKAFGKQLTGDMRIDSLALSIAKAQRSMNNFDIEMPSKIIPIMANEEPLEELAMASGGDIPVTIDLKKMNRNAVKRKE